MSLKVSLLAFGAGVAIVTGLTAYTSYQFEQQLQRGLTQQQAQLPHGASLTTENLLDYGVIRSDNYQIKWMTESHDAPILLQMDVTTNCRVWPLFIHCDAALEMEAGEDFAAFKQQLPVLDYDMGWQVNLWADSMTGWLTSKAFEAQIEQSTIKVGDMDLILTGDAEANVIDSHFMWQGLTVEEIKENGETVLINLGKTFLDAQTEQKSGLYLLGKGHYEIGPLKVNSAEINLAVAPIRIDAEIALLDDELMRIVYQTSIQELTLEKEQQTHQLTEISIHSAWDGMTYDNLIALERLNAEAEQSDVLALLDDVGKRPMTLTLNDWKATYNDMPVVLTGQVATKPFTAMEVMTAPGNVTLLHSALDLKVGQKIEQLVPQFLPQLQQFEQAQFIERNADGDYQTKLTLENGVISANGQPVHSLL